MTQYIQYDEEGNITAAIMGSGSAPVHPRQLMLDVPITILNKRVDLDTLEIIDIPLPPE